MSKPASGTALDTGNALYTSLAAVWAFLEGSGTTSADSKGSRTLTLSSSGLWATNGSAENIIRIGSGSASLTNLVPASSLTLPTNASWTLAWRGKQLSSNNHGMIAGDTATTTNFVWWQGGAKTDFRSNGADNNFTAVTDFTTTKNYVLTFTWTSGVVGDVRFYINGSQSGSTITGVSGTLLMAALAAGYSDAMLALEGDLEYVYAWSGRALDGTEVGTLNSSPYGFFGSAASFTIAPTAIPKNHPAGNLTLTLTGTGTSWVNASTTMTASGVSGWSVVSTTVSSGTAATVVLSCPSSGGATGTLTLTEGVTGTATATTTVGTPSFTVSPSSGATGTTPTLTFAGTNTVWSQETAAGLFSVSGGTGASIGTPTITTNTAGTVVLTVGSVAGTLTITDNSTGATQTFTATAGTIAITAPVANQWKRGGGSAVNFTVSGTYTGSVTIVQVSTDGSTWATLDAAPSGGNYSGTVSLAASESDYTVSVRFSNATSVTASVAGIANIRKVKAIGGQSNEAGRGTSNQTVHSTYGSGTHRQKTASGYAVLADPSGTDGSAAGSYAVHEINILGTALGYRLGLCNFAVGGTTIQQWQKGGTGAGYYEALAAACTAVGGCDLLTMGPWETDAINGTTQSSYHTLMAAFAASWLADFPSCKIIWRTGQQIDTGSATQPHQDAINAAILQGAGSTHGMATGDITGVYLAEVRSVPAYPGDTFHWLTDQQLADVGGIMASADYAAMNPTTGGINRAALPAGLSALG